RGATRTNANRKTGAPRRLIRRPGPSFPAARRYPSRSARLRADDVVLGAAQHLTYPADDVLLDAALLHRGAQVVHHPGEIVGADVESGVRAVQFAPVVRGRAAQRLRDEQDLMALEPVHVDTGEERIELRIGQHALVEAVYDRRNGATAADAVVIALSTSTLVNDVLRHQSPIPSIPPRARSRTWLAPFGRFGKPLAWDCVLLARKVPARAGLTLKPGSAKQTDIQ